MNKITQAIAAHSEDNLREAERLHRQILTEQPENAHFHQNSGGFFAHRPEEM